MAVVEMDVSLVSTARFWEWIYHLCRHCGVSGVCRGVKEGTGEMNCIKVNDLHHVYGIRVPFSITIVVMNN
jgi:hypothetical protein